MVINFRAHRISRGACKLTQTFTFILKKRLWNAFIYLMQLIELQTKC